MTHAPTKWRTGALLLCAAVPLVSCDPMDCPRATGGTGRPADWTGRERVSEERLGCVVDCWCTSATAVTCTWTCRSCVSRGDGTEVLLDESDGLYLRLLSSIPSGDVLPITCASLFADAASGDDDSAVR